MARRTALTRELSVASEMTSTLPHRIDQFFSADDPIAIANQMNEQIEDLRFDRNDLAGTTQFMTRDIDFKVRETECRAIHLRGGFIRIPALQSIALARPLTYRCDILNFFRRSS